jgi:hypothetical protein
LNIKQYLTPIITLAQPSPLDFSEPLSFMNDAHEFVVEEMATDKEQPHSAPPSTLLQNHSPTWISLVSSWAYPTARSRKRWVHQCLQQHCTRTRTHTRIFGSWA